MAVSFSVNHDLRYFFTKWCGNLTDVELLEGYKSFFESESWQPGLNEFVDMSEAISSEISSDAIRELALYCEELYKSHDINAIKTAVYAPNDLSYGIARMYTGWSGDSPESIRTFRDYEEAREWLEFEEVE